MRKFFLVAVLSVFVVTSTKAQRTPLMGWSSWNAFGLNINENVLEEVANALVDSGYAKAGYTYLNIDDGFWGGRDSKGNLIFDARKFPHGMKRVVDYIHNKGLKAGIYSDAGQNTCGGDIGVGLYQHDEQDCHLFFNQLNFDFLKVDFCGGMWKNTNYEPIYEKQRYTEIHNMILKTGGNKINYNVCRWDYPGTWVHDIADSWRISHDISCDWSNVKDIIHQGLYLSAYCYGGHYNDMDMLEVGRGLTMTEDKTHFALWCIMDSPLILGCDIRKVSEDTRKLLTNRDLISINQDSLELQGYVAARKDSCYILTKDLEHLHGKKRVVAIYNPTEHIVNTILDFSTVDLGGTVSVRDAFTHKNLGKKKEKMAVTVLPHGTCCYILLATKRLERTNYEGETGYISDYQELKNNQVEKTGIYEDTSGCSGGAKVAWLGCSGHNDLQFRHVYSIKGGKYKLVIGYMTPDTRNMVVSVNGQDVENVSVSNSSMNVSVYTLSIRLKKGDNLIRLSNKENWMPDIDYIKILKE